MSANLKANKDFLQDAEARRDLLEHEFLPVPVGDDQVEIVSNDGEAIVHMKDGVDYVLRFGGIAGIDSGSDEDKAGDKAAKKSDTADGADKKTDKGGLSRYIMVMAQYNPDTIAKPEMEKVPEIKKAPPSRRKSRLRKRRIRGVKNLGPTAPQRRAMRRPTLRVPKILRTPRRTLRTSPRIKKRWKPKSNASRRKTSASKTITTTR